MKKSTAKGFTLVELLITFSVAAVLMGIAVPAFRNMARSSSVTARTNDFILALNIARSEAMKRGIAVTVCSANSTLSGCSGTTNWATGLLVFTDDGATIGGVDAGEQIIQVWPASANVSHLSYTMSTYVRFLSSGATYNLTSHKVDIKEATSGKNPRCILVAKSGQITKKTSVCT